MCFQSFIDYDTDAIVINTFANIGWLIFTKHFGNYV